MKTLSSKLKLLGSIIICALVLSAFSINKNKRVTVCHKGRFMIRISPKAVPAHLKHGDKYGACQRIGSCKIPE